MLKQISKPYIKKINEKNYNCAVFEKLDGSTEEMIIRDSKHGSHHLSNTRLYSIWKGMRHRCSNPKRPGYKYYGGKGIQVCDEWDGKDGFLNFYNWSIKNGYDDSLTIDRINSNKDYNPDNCRWVSLIENCTKASLQKHYPKYKYIGTNTSENLYVVFYKLQEFSDIFNICHRRVSECANPNNQRNKYKGWVFERKELIVEGQETIPNGSTVEDEFPLEVRNILMDDDIVHTS